MATLDGLLGKPHCGGVEAVLGMKIELAGEYQKY